MGHKKNEFQTQLLIGLSIFNPIFELPKSAFRHNSTTRKGRIPAWTPRKPVWPFAAFQAHPRLYTRRLWPYWGLEKKFKEMWALNSKEYRTTIVCRRPIYTMFISACEKTLKMTKMHSNGPTLPSAPPNCRHALFYTCKY